MPSASKRETIKIIALVVLSIMLLSLSIMAAIYGPKHKVYDCSIAEISPDYPIEVKEECRRIRANYI